MLIVLSSQPRLAQEAPVEDNDADAQMVGEEGGESECDRASDNCLSDVDADDDRSVVTAKTGMNPSLCSAPTLRTGRAAMAPPAHVPKKRAKKVLAEQIAEAEDTAGDDELAAEAKDVDVNSEADIPEYFKRDQVLSTVALKLKKIYKCFWSLIPAQNLRTRKPAGHQIFGAWLSESQTCVQRPNLASSSASRGALFRKVPHESICLCWLLAIEHLSSGCRFLAFFS